MSVPCSHPQWVWQQIDDEPATTFCGRCGVTITTEGVGPAAEDDDDEVWP